MDNRGFRLVYAVSAALLLAALGAALAIRPTAPVLAGLGVGWALGLAPLASWHWAAARLAAGRVVALFVAKLALYGAVMYFLISQGRIDPIAAGVGMTLMPAVLAAVFLMRPAPQVN